MRVLCYIRVSSAGQLDGDGPDRQEAAMAPFCARHDLDARAIVESISGTVDGMDRPQLAEALKNNGAEHKLFDAIVVERLDRLARDLMVQELLIWEFQRLKIKLFSCDQGELIDLADACPDPTRKLIRQVMGAVAEYEKSNLVRKLRSARERLGKNGGGVAYGKREGEAPVLAAMLSLRHEGLSLRHIAERLNEEGLPQRNGGEWTHSSVSNILNNQKEGTMK